MIAQSDIPKTSELFTVYLSNYKHESDAPFYTFGYIDQASLGGQRPYYSPIDNSNGFWQFQSTSAVVAGKTIARSGNTAIADTGTTLALVGDDLCDAIYKAISGAKYDSSQQGYVFPSTVATSQLPSVSFAVGGKQFSVHKEDLAFADVGNGFVYGGVQSRGDLPFDILGDTWLKGVYAVSLFHLFYGNRVADIWTSRSLIKGTIDLVPYRGRMLVLRWCVHLHGSLVCPVILWGSSPSALCVIGNQWQRRCQVGHAKE